jgi:hypothetical protein
VTLENGEKLEYEDLILSPGGAPRRLPVEGANLSNVYTLRHVQDAQKIDAGEFCIIFRVNVKLGMLRRVICDYLPQLRRKVNASL